MLCGDGLTFVVEHVGEDDLRALGREETGLGRALAARRRR